MARHVGTANLIPVTKETAKEIGRLGGLATAEKRKKKQELKDILEVLLEMDNPDGTGMTNAQQMCIAALNKAIKGDLKALELIRDTIGQMPVSKVKLDNDSIININVDDKGGMPDAAI